jgi:hypothetical protein
MEYQKYVVLWDRIKDLHISESAATAIGLFSVVALIYLVAYLLNKKPREKMGEADMVQHFRNRRVAYIVGEGITEIVEEAVFRDQMTRAEAMDVYTKIGREFGLIDLLPKRRVRNKLSRGECEHLKEQIRKRIDQQTNNVIPIEHRKLYFKR